MSGVDVRVDGTSTAGNGDGMVTVSQVSLLAGGSVIARGSIPHGRDDTELRAFLLAEQALEALPDLSPIDVARTIVGSLAHAYRHNGNGSAGPHAHTFTMADLIGKAPKAMDYLPLLGHDGVFVKGATHLLASWWRVGKSETLSQACAEWLSDGHRVLWLSEEPEDPVWRDRCLELVDRFGLDVPWSNLKIADIFAAGASPKIHLDLATSGPEDIVILDTVYAVIGCADEDKASVVRPAMMPWISGIRARGKTLIGLVHHRKQEGKHGERVTGSHALPALFDVVIEMTMDDAKPTQRKLTGRARRVRVPELVLEMDDDGRISVVGTGSQVDGKELYRMAIELLGKQGSMATKDIAHAFSHVSNPKTTERALVHLARSAHIVRNPDISEPAKGRRVTWSLADQTRFL